MTVYRLRMDLIFPEKADAITVGQALQAQLPKVRNLVNEKSYIELEECYHDESPFKPCKILQRIEKP